MIDQNRMEPGDNIARLTEGLNINDLLSEGGATFSINYSDFMENDEPEEMTYDSQDVLQYLKPELCDLQDEDDYQEGEPFEILARKMTDVLPDGKIKKRILCEGYSSIVPDKSEVVINYNAYNEYNDEPFDSSYIRRHPFRFKLGVGETIPGLDIAVATMKMGEKAQFLITYHYAYGELGSLERVPPKATVLFEVELKDFMENSAATAPDTSSKEKKNTFTAVNRDVQCMLRKAKDLYNKGMIRQACTCYNQVVKKLAFCQLQDMADEREQQNLLLRTYSNLVIAYTKLNEPRRACANYNSLVQMCRGTSLKIGVKVFFNHARSVMRLGDFQFAERQLRFAQKLEPHNVEVSREFGVINKLAKEHLEREVAIAKAMFVNTEINREPQDKSKITQEFKASIEQFCVDLSKDEQNDRYVLPDNLVKEELEYIKVETRKHGLILEERSAKSTTRKNFIAKAPTSDNE